METAEWVFLQTRACGDLPYAAEELPPEVRMNIYKYSCVEKNRYALGETLDKLQPDQFNRICTRLSEKGYKADCHEALKHSSEIAAVLAAGALLFIVF